MRSEQLLRAMQKVFSHDLPNEMVVLQSLLQLLDAEESAGLGATGREYLQRLKSATRRAGDMVRFLKEMGRVNNFTAKAETLALANLARELQGELQRVHPDRLFEFAWHWDVPAIVGDGRVFLQALLELFGGLLSPRGKACRVSARSELHGDAIEVAVDVEGSLGQRPTPEKLEQRMEIVLAREWLALCGAGVEVTLPADGIVRFSIVVPDRIQ